MTRSFDGRNVAADVIDRIVDLGTRAPSAGKTQGWHLIVLRGAETARFWDITLPAERRQGFRWQGLLAAPVIAIPLADPNAYIERYAEPDKVRSGLGTNPDAWPTPYWTVDASMSLMTMLLAAENEGLGALLFGIFNGEPELREALRIPEHLQVLGAIALGWPSVDAAAARHDPGLSASRRRRQPAEVVHPGGW